MRDMRRAGGGGAQADMPWQSQPDLIEAWLLGGRGSGGEC